MLSPKLKLCFVITLLAVTNFCYGQIPSYYNDVNLSLTGIPLRDELATKIINTHTNFLSYSNVWDACKATDVDPTDATKVLLIYGYNDTDGNVTTDRTRGINNNGGTVGQWNREHVYPKSLGNPSLGTSGAGSDAHSLRPCDIQRNSSRNNKQFINGSGNSGAVGTGWYPGDEWKGDVARMMMYMYLRYGNQCLPSNVTIGTTNSVDSNMIDLLLTWNAEDPVSQIEINRNNYHEDTNNANAQGNRNPFIDNPALATKIWGGIQAQDLFVDAPEINILGNNNTIFDGSTSTSTSNDTDFGSTDTTSGSITKTFTIQNVGTQTLTISNPTINGTDASEFTITSNPATLTINSGSSETFTVVFDPTSDGVKDDAEIIITSNDADEATYNFAIKGTGTSGSGSTCGTELFFSEYMEGSSNNKFLEVFNPTNSTVDLSDYDIVRYANGSSSVSGTYALSGSLASNDVIVIEDSSENITGFEGDLSTPSAAMDFNGDDAVALRKNGVIIDVIGRIGQDPGSEWTSSTGCSQGTANAVLRRKPDITAGDTNGSDAFDPGIEWDCSNSDDVSNFGSHTVNCSSPEIEVQGNSIEIVSGDTTPSNTDDTNFGSAATNSGSVTKTYTILNTGSADLTIAAINIINNNTTDFTVSTSPSSSVTSGNSTTFSITFSPTADGVRTTTVSIDNNDSDENPYEFTIEGQGTSPPPSGDPSTIVVQDFDGTPTEWGFSTDVAFFDNNSDGFFGIHDANNNPNDGTPADTGDGNATDINAINYSEISGDFLFVNDLDDEGDNGTTGTATLAFNSVDLSSYNDVVFSFDYDITGFDTGDDIEYELIYDGISQNDISIKTSSSVEGTITVNIPNSVTNLELNIKIVQNGDSDQAAIDNIKLTTSSSPNNAIACANSGGFSDLIISEIYDAPSGSLGYIEIYNGTANTIDLTDYEINRFANLTGGSSSHTYTFPNSGTGSSINAGDVLIGKISNTSDVSGVTSDFTFTGSTSGFNDNDRLELEKISTSTVIDDWHDDSVSGTTGFSYQRNTNIAGPNPTYDASEWTGTGSQTTTNLGIYNFSGASSETTWNGTTWSNGEPTQTTKAIIDGDYNMNTQNSIETCECEIRAGASLTIVSDKYINIQNNLINEGNIVIENNGSLVQVGNTSTITGTGSYTIKRQTTSLANNYAYTYWSSPISSATLSSITDTSTFYYSYNNTIQDWEDADKDTEMIPAKGYITNGPSAGSYPMSLEAVFTGAEFNNGEYTVTTKYNGEVELEDGSMGLSDNDDWGIAGNPYPSAIDAEQFLLDNETLNGTLYFWSHNTVNTYGDQQNSADFVPWNATGSLTICDGCVQPTGMIASGQAFTFASIVKSGDDPNANATYDIRFLNSQRVAGNNTNFYRSTEKDRIWLNLQGEKDFSQNLFGFLPNATNGIDRLYDAKTIESGDVILYSMVNSESGMRYLSIQGKPELENEKEEIIPLGIYVGTPQEISFSIDKLEGKLNDVTVLLEDTELNTIHDLKESAYVTKIDEVGNHEERFKLLINAERALSTNSFEAIKNTLTIIDNNDILEIKNNENINIKNVVVYDILGKELVNVKTNSNSVKTSSKQLKKSSILIVKTLLENGQTFSDKLIKK